MSDHKRAALTTVGSSKLNQPVKEAGTKVLRLNVTLPESNKDWCPVLNYHDLIRNQEKKDLDGSNSGKHLNGSILSLSDDEEKGLKRIAKQFEEKYGTNDKRKRCQTYTELGAGYDESDSFIDNTEACEEGLGEFEKKQEGYYVNILRFDKVLQSDKSDQEEFRPKNKKVARRIVDFSSDDEGVFEEPLKKSKLSDPRGTSLEETDAVKVKKCTEVEKKKAKPLKAPLEEKRSIEVAQKPELLNIPPKAVIGTEGHQTAIASPELKKTNEDHKSVTDVIESVVNAGNAELYNNQDSDCSDESCSNSGSEVSQKSEKASRKNDGTPPILPEDLPAELKNLIAELKVAASKISDTHRKAFSPEVNSLVMRVEMASRTGVSASMRRTIYTHLSFFLPCTKATLLNRAKKLICEEENKQIDTIIAKIKEMVDSMMPKLQESYAMRCLKRAKAKTPEPGNSTHLEGENQKSSHPRKTFTWNETLKNYLKNLIQIKVRLFYISHERGQTLDVYMANFLNNNLLSLWPSGWMKISSLMKHSIDTLQEEAKRYNIPFSVTAKNSALGTSPLDAVLSMINVPSEVNHHRPKKTTKPAEKQPNFIKAPDFQSLLPGTDPTKEPSEPISIPSIFDSPKEEFSVIKLDRSKVPSRKRKNSENVKVISLNSEVTITARDMDRTKDPVSERIKDLGLDRPKESVVDRLKDSGFDKPKVSLVDRPNEFCIDSPKDFRIDSPKDFGIDSSKDFGLDRPNSRLDSGGSSVIKSLSSTTMSPVAAALNMMIHPPDINHHRPKKMKPTEKQPNEPVQQFNEPHQFVSKPPHRTNPATMSLKHRILNCEQGNKDVEQGQNVGHKSSDANMVNWSDGLFDKIDDVKTNPQKTDELASVENALSMSPSEAERRLHEETTAATDILSQLITDQNSHSQNVPACGVDDKVRMQLNEVMQDLAVLNQMSADTVDNSSNVNTEPCSSLSMRNRRIDNKESHSMPSFQDEFYSHLKKELYSKPVSGNCEPPTFYEDIPTKSAPASNFITQDLSSSTKPPTLPTQSQSNSTGNDWALYD